MSKWSQLCYNRVHYVMTEWTVLIEIPLCKYRVHCGNIESTVL